MARYIDADKIKKEHKRFIGYLDEDMIWRLNFVTDKIPTADVAEVKHGKWVMVEKEIKTDGDYDVYKCSLCGRKIVCDRYPTKSVEELFPYCHCGAKMEEETESKRIDTLKKVSRMIAEGKIPNEVYDEYLSDTPLGFRTADEVLEYLLYGG